MRLRREYKFKCIELTLNVLLVRKIRKYNNIFKKILNRALIIILVSNIILTSCVSYPVYNERVIKKDGLEVLVADLKYDTIIISGPENFRRHIVDSISILKRFYPDIYADFKKYVHLIRFSPSDIGDYYIASSVWDEQYRKQGLKNGIKAIYTKKDWPSRRDVDHVIISLYVEMSRHKWEGKEQQAIEQLELKSVENLDEIKEKMRKLDKTSYYYLELWAVLKAIEMAEILKRPDKVEWYKQFLKAKDVNEIYEMWELPIRVYE